MRWVSIYKALYTRGWLFIVQLKKVLKGVFKGVFEEVQLEKVPKEVLEGI